MDYLVRWAIRSPDDRVLDPACGDAAFLDDAVARLANLGAGEPQVVGFDIDAEAVGEARRRAPTARVIEGDFFQQAHESYDAVVGNPPYVRYHYFDGEVRQRALGCAAAQGVRLSQLTSSWAPFVVHASSLLARGGRLGFVLPGELLSTDYARPVRDYLVRRFATVDVLTFDSRVFPGALVDAVLLLAEGEGPGALRIHQVASLDGLLSLDLSTGVESGGRKWTDAFASVDAVAALHHEAAGLVPLGSIAEVDIGVVTGANDFFVLTDDVVAARGLPQANVVRSVGRLRQLPHVVVRMSDWEKSRDNGEAAWLVSIKEFDEATAAYVAEGEQAGIHRRFKCRVRRPWWRLRLGTTPDMLLSYMSGDAPRLVVNEAGLSTTNLIHNVHLSGEVGWRTRPLGLAVGWWNSATLFSAELSGRAYGGGVLKLETREAESVLVPGFDEAKARALEAIQAEVASTLHSGSVERALDLVDRIVLDGLNDGQLAAIRAGWLALRARRKSRERSRQSATPVV